MGLIDQIKQDIHQITSNSDEFGVTLLFETTTSPITTATVYGTSKKHRTQFDDYGMPKTSVNTKVVTCTVSTLEFDRTSYPYKTDGVINFSDHLVTWSDAVDGAVQYTVAEWHPNEKLGLINFILEEYGG